MRDESKATYLNIMIDSLKKKEKILEGLKAETVKQAGILEKQELDADAFEAAINAKQGYLDELEKQDEGFMDMYEKVKDSIKETPSDYALEIAEAKELIKKQTEMSIELQALEEKNRTRLAVHLTSGRQKMRDFRTSSQTAAAYYKNMSNRHQEGDSYFLDSKK